MSKIVRGCVDPLMTNSLTNNSLVILRNFYIYKFRNGWIRTYEADYDNNIKLERWSAEVWRVMHVVVDAFKDYSDGHIYVRQSVAAPQATKTVAFISLRDHDLRLGRLQTTSIPAISAPVE